MQVVEWGVESMRHGRQQALQPVWGCRAEEHHKCTERCAALGKERGLRLAAGSLLTALRAREEAQPPSV